MVELEIKDDLLVVHVKGVDKFLAFKSQMDVPLSHIVDAHIGIDDQTKEEFKHLWRLPGAYMPGIVVAGSFVNKENKQFWDIHDKAKAIVIELTDLEYNKLVLEVADPNAAVATIKQAIAK